MCFTSFDCPTNMLCLPGFMSPEVPNNVTFCGCAVFPYGMSKAKDADVCSVWGPNTSYVMGAFLLMLGVAGLLQIHFTFVLVRLRQRGSFKMNDMMVTFLLLLSANVFMIISTTMSMVELLTPHVEHVSFGLRKLHPISSSKSMISLISESFTLFAVSNVPLVWIHVVKRTQNYGVSSGGARSLRIAVRLYQLFVLLTRLISFGITGNRSLHYAVAIAGLGLMGVALIFVVARQWFAQMFKKFSSKTLSSKGVLERINFLTLVVAVSMVVATISLLIYVFISLKGFEMICSKTEMCWPYLWRDTTSIAVLVVKAACQRYCALGFGFGWCSYEDPAGTTSENKVHTRMANETSSGTQDRSTNGAFGTSQHMSQAESML